MSPTDNPRSASQNSLLEATRSRASFSGHAGGRARGAAGYVSDTDDACDFLATTGNHAIFNAPEGGFGDIQIGAAWQPLDKPKHGFIEKFIKREPDFKPVDLDLGVLYEMNDGSRGCIQAFGGTMGQYESAPYMALNGDDVTGEDHDDIDGQDEIVILNGQKWSEIKRALVYLYIYEGACHWAEIAPQVQIIVPNEKPVVVTLHTYKSELPLAAVVRLENVRGGIRLTNMTEYYPGHPSMDRAYGFGIEWEDGQK